MIILSFCFNDITKSTIKMLECINIGDSSYSESRLKIDYGIDCKSTQYKAWFYLIVLPILLIIGFLYPVFIIFNLYYYHWKK